MDSIPIINNPYFTKSSSGVLEPPIQLTAPREYFDKSEYYPSPNDKNIFKIQLNINFAVGPSFNGLKFIYPEEPYSTNGRPKETECQSDRVSCTYKIIIPLGSIVEMTLTAYSPLTYSEYYHPMHIHGHEFYTIGIGHSNRTNANADYPNGFNTAFRCIGRI